MISDNWWSVLASVLSTCHHFINIISTFLQINLVSQTSAIQWRVRRMFTTSCLLLLHFKHRLGLQCTTSLGSLLLNIFRLYLEFTRLNFLIWLDSIFKLMFSLSIYDFFLNISYFWQFQVTTWSLRQLFPWLYRHKCS